jgi:chromosome segregation ATPase
MAEVAITFDNSDGRAPAEFAGFTEIQIARRCSATAPAST